MEEKIKKRLWILGALMVLLILFSVLVNLDYSKKELEKFECDQRGEVCFEIYDPVCGWFSGSVQCLKYPCAETFVNNCFACQNEKISYYTKGVCPDEK